MRELQTKEHLSYEPNPGLSLVKEPWLAVLIWIRCEETAASSRAPCLLREGRGPELASDESIWLELKEQAGVSHWALSDPWSSMKGFVFHVSSKYLIKSCIVILLLLGAGSSRIL